MIFGHRFRLFSCGYVSVQWLVNLCFFSTKPKTKRYLNEEEKKWVSSGGVRHFSEYFCCQRINSYGCSQSVENYLNVLFWGGAATIPTDDLLFFFCLWWFNSEIQFPEWSSFPALCGTRPVVPVFASGMSVDPSCAGSSALRTFRSLPGCMPWGPAFGAGDARVC